MNNLKNKINKTFGILGIEKKNKPEEEQISIPKDTSFPIVIFTDKKLHISLGQWMNIMPNTIRQSLGGGNAIYMGMSVEELLKQDEIQKEKGYITGKKLDEIQIRFGRLLSLVGIPATETCILSDFNDKKNTFKCVFKSTGKSATITYYYGGLEDSAELIIEDENARKVYYYYEAYEKKPDKLVLQSETQKLDNKGRKFHHFVSEFTYYGDIYDEENQCKVEIKYPKSLEYDYEPKDNIYIDEKKMEELLSTITFPANIEEICQLISQALKQDPASLPSISVTIKKLDPSKNKSDNFAVTDRVDFSNGKFAKIIITRNGKTINITDFSNWSYTSPQYHASITDNTINCGYNNLTADTLSKTITPEEIVSLAKSEVDSIKKLALTMFQQQKK